MNKCAPDNNPPSPRSPSEARERLVDLVRSYINDPYHLHIGFVENSKDLLAGIDAERNRPYDLLPDSRPQAAEADDDKCPFCGRENGEHAPNFCPAYEHPPAPQPSGEGRLWLRLGVNMVIERAETHPGEAYLLESEVLATRAPEGRAITKEEEALIEGALKWNLAQITGIRLAHLINAVAATRPKTSEQEGK